MINNHEYPNDEQMWISQWWTTMNIPNDEQWWTTVNILVMNNCEYPNYEQLWISQWWTTMKMSVMNNCEIPMMNNHEFPPDEPLWTVYRCHHDHQFIILSSISCQRKSLRPPMSKNELEASHVTERAAWRPLMPNKELGPPMPNKELHGGLPCQRKS